MKKTIAAFVAVSTLLGCVEYQTARPADVRFTSGANAGVTGYHSLPVRAFLGRASQKTEMRGVPCEVIGSGFKAQVQTPAAVNVPVYGLKSKALYVSCKYEGEMQDISLAPVNLTESKALSNGAAGGVLGVIVTSAVVAGRKNKQDDEYGYNNVNMIFKKGETTSE